MSNHPLDRFLVCPVCGSKRFDIVNIKAKRCEDCGFEYYANASAAVVAVIINSRNELLITRRAKEPVKGTWDLPGGFVDMDESAEQAVIREISEELSLDVQVDRYLFSIPNLYTYSGMDIHTLDYFFLCSPTHEQVIEVDDDVDMARYVALNKIRVEDFGLSSIRVGLARLMELF